MKPKTIPAMIPSKKATTWYEQRLIHIMDLIWADVERDVLPLFSNKIPSAVLDAKLSPEKIVQLLTTAIETLDIIINKYSSSELTNQYQRIAQGAISIASAEADKDFKEAMQNAIGVDVEPLYKDIKFRVENKDGELITVNLEGAIKNNTDLIKTIPKTYLGPMRDMLQNGVYQTYTAEELAANILQGYDLLIKEKYNNVSKSYIARRIARDQMAKVYSQTTRQRQEDSGVEYFKWQTSDDERVSGNPSGVYKKAKVSCYDISRDNQIKKGEGVYSVKDGATWDGESNLFPGSAHIQCRCVMIPLIDGVNYDSATGKYKKPKMPKGTT